MNSFTKWKNSVDYDYGTNAALHYQKITAESTRAAG